MEKCKLAADLHIHTCLSPCASMEMTPNNTVNMAYLKGLEAIAICDHNSALNLPACKAVADAREMVFIPGIEVETKEEVHVLCYFETVDTALEFGDYIYKHLPPIKNKPDFFGEQVVMDEDDEVVKHVGTLLSQSTTLSIDDVVEACRERGGVPVPAHINRQANSILSALGFLPPSLDFASIEVYKHVPISGVNLDEYHVLYDSDAHQLEDILEKDQFITSYGRSTKGLLQYLAEKK